MNSKPSDPNPSIAEADPRPDHDILEDICLALISLHLVAVLIVLALFAILSKLR